jgi:asparagine synthase (glutamine-hydrolysing)
MTRASPEPIHTFSIGFPDEPSFDERGYARTVADHFASRHTEFSVEVDAVGLMDTLLWHHDQPYADSSAIPTFIVAKLAREHVTVVLNGDGGDEVFGGYDRFVAARLAGLIPRSLAHRARSVTGLVPRADGYYSPRRRAERFLEQAERPVKDRYQAWIAVLNDELLTEMLDNAAFPDPAAHVTTSMERHYARVSDAPELDQILYANFKTYLPDDLAVKMDRMSMAHSLEARSPFLDTAVIEYCARLRASRKVGLRRVKPLLRQAFRDLLPDEIWNRKKHGFGVPMGTWFRKELGPMFEDEVLADDARTNDFLRRDALLRLWNEHQTGEREHGFRFWTILTLEHWLRGLNRPDQATEPADGLVSA